MRQKFAFYPDGTRSRHEPYAVAKKAAIVFGLVVAGVAAMHVLYPSVDAAADASRAGDVQNQAQNNQAPDRLGQGPGAQHLTEQAPLPVSASPLPPAAIAADQTAPRVAASQDGDASQKPAPGPENHASSEAKAGENRPGENRGGEAQNAPSSERPTGKVAERSHSTKKKSSQPRHNGGDGVYAQNPYWGGYASQWAYAQRSSHSYYPY